MTEQQHRATPDEWACIKGRANDLADHAAYSTIQELLHRIEALEAATQSAKSNHPEIPDSSLLLQVAAVIENGTACDRKPKRIACDTIRAIADWLWKHYDGQTATIYLLEEEAKE